MTDNLLQPQADQLNVDLDPNKNYLTDLVGEGKKFSTPEELAKGKYHADQTVEVLKQRLDEMRADYLKLRDDNSTKSDLAKLIEDLKTQRLSNSETPPANDNKSAIDPNELKSLISNQYQELKASERAADNYRIVTEKLTERFGTNYQTALTQRSNELGLSGEDITALAKKSPTAFFRTLGLDQPAQQEGFQAPPRSSQRNDNFAPTGRKERTWSYYQELKKADPKLYFDPKIGAQMAQDVTELGDKFYDGDFYVRGLHDK